MGNDCINEHYIQSVAIHTLSILFNKLTGHYVRISLDLLFNYINENDKWCPPSLSISIMKIVKGSMQVKIQVSIIKNSIFTIIHL